MFQIQLDSAYRNKTEYPLSTEFVVFTNSTPLDSNIVTDTQFTYSSNVIFISNPIYFQFRWIGDTTLQLSSDMVPLSNNAVIGSFVSFSNAQRIELPIEFLEKYQLNNFTTSVNYFGGLLFVIYKDTTYTEILASSVITFFDPLTRAIDLSSPLPSSIFETLQPPYVFAIVNSTASFGNNCQTLGTYVFSSIFAQNYISEFFLKNGPSDRLWLQNVTKGWSLPIQTFLNNNRLAITSTKFPSYENGNVFQIRLKNPYPSLFQTDMGTLSRSVYQSSTFPTWSLTIRQLFFASSILKWRIMSEGQFYVQGTQVYLLPLPSETYLAQPNIFATLEIRQVGNLGNIREAVLSFPGSLYFTNKSYFLSVSTTAIYDPIRSAVVQIDATSLVLQCKTGLSLPPNVSQTNLIYAPNVQTPSESIETIPNCLFLCTSIYQYESSTFVYYQVYPFQYKTTTRYYPAWLIEKSSWIEWVPLYQRYPALNLPMSSFQQPSCFKIRLLSLSIPNQPIFGFSVLPSFFPYFILEIYNTSGLASNIQSIYSNNPHTQKATFICQIANPRNQLVANYLVVHSLQMNVMKWLPTDHIFCRIALPNGETLRYVEDVENSKLIVESKDEFVLRNLYATYTSKNVSVQLLFSPVIH